MASWVEHADIVAAATVLLIAVIGYYLRSDRKSLIESMQRLADRVDKLVDKLEAQREDMHEAILDHERRIATLEGAHSTGIRSEQR